MTIRISDLNGLSVNLAQVDLLAVVDVSASETKKVTVADLITRGISGVASGVIDIAKLNQSSTTKLSNDVLSNAGVVSGVYGSGSSIPQITINDKGIITNATGVSVSIAASDVSGLAAVATSGTYDSLTGTPTLGTLSSQSAGNVTISGGSINTVTLSGVTIFASGGTISGITDLAIADGGTAASTASGARSNLGLVIGSDVQPYSAILSGVSEQFDVADTLIYASASGIPDNAPFTAFGRSIVSGSTASGVRSTLGLGDIATQDSNNISISGGTVSGVTFTTGNATISGGTITGITDLAIGDGGTGASTASGARANLGVTVGSDVQAYSAILSGVSEQFTTTDTLIYASASGVVSSAPFTSFGRSIVSGSTASGVRSTLGLGSAATQNTNNINITGGTVSGVTFTSSNVTISGGTISGITDLAIADGGTAASTASGARANLGLDIGSDIQAYSSVLSGVSEQFTTADTLIYASASGVVSSAPLSAFGRSVVSGSTASGVRSTLGLGTIATQDSDNINITGGTVSGVTLTSSNVTISGGTISGITDLAIEDGGTAASTASGARTNLGLAIGSDIQSYSAILSGVSEQFTEADTLIYASASGVVDSAPLTSLGRSIISGSTASGVRETLGLGSIATQDFDNVTISGGTVSGVTLRTGEVVISGGTITGITDLAIADGGTGASTASGARANLGLSIGSDVQAYSAILSGVSEQFTAIDTFIYASASGVVDSAPFTAFGRSIVSGSTASGVRSTLGLGSIATQGSGNVDIGGGTISGVTLTSNNVNITGGTIVAITDLAISDGGTGASTASGARINLGLEIGSDIQAYSAILSGVSEQFTVANTFPYASASGVVDSAAISALGLSIVSGTTASGIRATLGLGDVATQDTNNISIIGGTISGVTFNSSDVTISGGTITGITDLAVADGGTGASTASGARTNLGLVIGSDVQAYSSALSGITAAASGADLVFYTTVSGVVDSTSFSSFARTLVAETTASGVRSELGLGSVALLDTILIGSGNITNESIGTDQLADSGVTRDKLSDSIVNFDKLLDASQSDVIIGRATSGGGSFEEIACTSAARSILDDASIADIRTTLGLGTLATQNGNFAGSSTGTNTGDQTIILTGDVTGSGTGSFAATVSNDAITTAKILNSAVTNDKIVDSGVTAIKLADQSTSVVLAGTPNADGIYVGQKWFNTNDSIEYTWVGTAWSRQAAINSITTSGDLLYSYSTETPDSFSANIVPVLNTQVASLFFAGPATGGDAAPTFRAIASGDLPVATSSGVGGVRPGTGLQMVGSAMSHVNSISGDTFLKVVVDNEGHVSSGATALVVADIPNLDASKITTGTFASGFIGNKQVNGTKLADHSVTRFGETTPVAEFTGQFFFNPLEKDLFLWDGNVWNPVGVTIGEIIFAGTYNASGNTIGSVSSEGSAVGLTVGQPLPSPSNTFNRYYVIVESGGTGTSPAPETELNPPDLLLCNGSAWVEIDVSSTYQSQTAVQIGFAPAASISSTNVQAALEEVSNECRNANSVASGVLDEEFGGTGQSSYTKGDLIAASGATDLGLVSVGTNGQVLTVDLAQDTGLTWATPSSGTVLSVNATAPLFVVSGTTTPHITVSGASTTSAGVVQLTDSVATTSSTLAATATAVKNTYTLASGALARSGGTLTGNLNLDTDVDIVFEGSTSNGFETVLTVADPTDDRVITLPNISGTVITNADTGTVTNTMLAGSIADSKLNTISTALKVSNSATTATDANTASAIVARDGSGNFSAGTITATIDEGTY